MRAACLAVSPVLVLLAVIAVLPAIAIVGANALDQQAHIAWVHSHVVALESTSSAGGIALALAVLGGPLVALTLVIYLLMSIRIVRDVRGWEVALAISGPTVLLLVGTVAALGLAAFAAHGVADQVACWSGNHRAC